MSLTKLYKEILKTGLMSVDNEGMVVQISSVDEDRENKYSPVVIDGLRLVMPTQYHIDNPDVETKIIFHPLSENALQGESAVINKLKLMTSVAVNLSIFNLIRGLCTLALSVEDHKKLTPEQSEILSILKNIDNKSVKDFIKIILAGIKKEGYENFFFKIFLKRGGSIDGKKYARVAVVTFKFYEELCKNPEEVYGIPLRKKDQGVLKELLEYILPNIGKPHAYDQGSDDHVAPYLDALMSGIAGVATSINKVTERFADFLQEPEKIKISVGFQKLMRDLTVYLPEVRRIPAQRGNQGNRKIEEKKLEEANIQEAIAAADRAVNKSASVEEKSVAQVRDTTPPWEDVKSDPRQSNEVITVPYQQVTGGVPLMTAPAQVDPRYSNQGTQEKGTISISELLGVGYPNQQPMYPQQGQPYPMQQFPGQPYPMQQQPYGYPQQQTSYPSNFTL